METKVDFDYSIGTEDRFALRNWLEAFIAAQNTEDVEQVKQFLSVGLVVEGFTEASLSKETFVNFLVKEKQAGRLKVIQYSDTKVKFKDESFVCVANLQGLGDNILYYEGSIELEVVKAAEGFIADYIKFYPRLKVSN